MLYELKPNTGSSGEFSVYQPVLIPLRHYVRSWFIVVVRYWLIPAGFRYTHVMQIVLVTNKTKDFSVK